MPPKQVPRQRTASGGKNTPAHVVQEVTSRNDSRKQRQIDRIARSLERDGWWQLWRLSAQINYATVTDPDVILMKNR